GVDAGDRGEVDDRVAAFDGVTQRVGVEDVAAPDLDLGMGGQARRGQCVAVVVVEDDDAVLGEKPLDQVRADEARAPGDADSTSDHGGHRATVPRLARRVKV